MIAGREVRESNGATLTAPSCSTNWTKPKTKTSIAPILQRQVVSASPSIVAKNLSQRARKRPGLSAAEELKYVVSAVFDRRM